MEIEFIKKSHGISVYRDPYMDSSLFLFGRKGKEVDSGLIWVPAENFKDVKGAAFEKEEVDKILKDSIKNTKFSDYTFLICNLPDDKIDVIDELLLKLKEKLI